MSDLWIITVLKISLLSFVSMVDDRLPIQYNYPLVMIEVEPESFPDIPKTVEITNGKTIFKYDSKSDVKYFCPTENTELIDVIKRTPDTADFYIHNCLSETTFGETSPKLCKSSVHPFLQKYQFISGKLALTYGIRGPGPNETSQCGINKQGTLYGLGYLLCLPGSVVQQSSTRGKDSLARRDMIIYNFCFDHRNEVLLYTRHLILSPSILKNIDRISDLVTYQWNEISTNSYNTFDDAFDKINQIIQEEGMVPHMTIPPENMALGTWKKVLYHYSNVMGMPQEISALWKFIDNGIRQAAIQSDSELELYMGEFTVKVRFEEKQLWCKLIFDEKNSRSAAIIVYDNNGHNHPRHNHPGHTNPTANLKIMNNCTLCDFKKLNGSDKVGNELKLAHCCKVSDEHLKIFGLMSEIIQRGRPKRVYESEKYSKITAKYLNLTDISRSN